MADCNFHVVLAGDDVFCDKRIESLSLKMCDHRFGRHC